MSDEAKARLAKALRNIADQIESGGITRYEFSIRNELQESPDSRAWGAPTSIRRMEDTGFRVLTLRYWTAP